MRARRTSSSLESQRFRTGRGRNQSIRRIDSIRSCASRVRATLIALGAVAVFACGARSANESATDGSTPAPVATNAGATPRDAATETSRPPIAKPNRFLELKGVLHMHSPWSHDACDDEGLTEGVPNASCLADLRAAPCKTGYDFVALTDHAAHMNEYDARSNVLYDAAAGDVLVKDDDDAVIGNRMTCPDGHEVLFTFGFEGDHTLPLALKRHPSRYDGYTKDRPIAEVISLVADLHDAGAIVALAHSEEDNIDAPTIVQGGADAMEWYNPHGNFKTALGGDKITGQVLDLIPLFRQLEGFMAGSSSGAHPDLFYLLLLPKWPQKGFDKWREVQKSRFVPGILGSDIHQNVSVDPICKGAAQVLCTTLLGAQSGALAQLIAGGQLMMSDNRRFDAYERLMRWLHNRVFVKSLGPDGLREAIAHGRSYGLFSVFGEPSGFHFDGVANGEPVDLGDEVAGPITLNIQLPTAPAPIPSGPSFDATASARAEVRATLFRTDAKGTTEVANGSGLGEMMTLTATEPGSYHVEVRIKPKQLSSVLGNQGALAEEEYMWLITNPIRVK
jgi:hypothetical protein